MSLAFLSICDELEAAVAARNADKCAETTARVTALFLASAGSFSDDQIQLFGDVFERLINTIELRAIADVGARVALAEMSAQLAPVRQAPASVMRRLARYDDISIAAPVLSESARLTADDLIELAKTKGEKHLLAISGRWWLQEIVTDALLARCFPSVSRRLVDNPGARVSATGFAIVIAQAASDPELAIATGIRADLPSELRSTLLREATDTVRTRLLSRAPPFLFEEIRAAVAAASAGAEREMSRARDFPSAKLVIACLKKEGRLNERALLDFAQARKYEETVTALAELSKASVEVVRPLMQSLRSEGILVPCRVAGLRWETVGAVLNSRFSSGVMAPEELSKLKREFDGLTLESAHRLLKLWTVKSTSSGSTLN
ncbi:DUF2336 domain-containing protein [Bradyrhizobium sp.]|uniref:DUF2336 domain-containing protein n=1 Tax=Bradyrhizobium sp. TaxID=376 RepID=UPI001D284384|nr:DUF2336 domain-containing protein [Bradyrhizobium sp.]MBV8696514.1 DUF2336 domain-containing protein [Bradyrhizobium sp.]MBV9984461.1 DUF2336 domain-containing protein [Bradyrhizobium sp.]